MAISDSDLVVVLAEWGVTHVCRPYRPADLDRDCEVGLSDLLVVLAQCGGCT